MHRQDHIAGVVCDDGVRVRCDIVEELVEVLHFGFCWVGLMRGEGLERGEHREIDGACIVEENPMTSWTNFLLALERRGEASSSVAYCTFFPYAGLTCR